MIFLQSIPLLPDSLTTTASQTAADTAGDLKLLKTLSIEDLLNKLAHTMVDFAFHLAIAILVFYLGRFIIRRLYSFVAGVLSRRRVDTSLTTFILSLVRIVLYFILVVTVIGILGINTSSFIALFASAGVAIGMALSGTLQNFAGGVLILLLKPYKVGDYIETQGYAGRVTEIQIFSTIICTYDNKSIIIPNGGLSTGTINNWSRESYRRIDWTISISYGDNVDTARNAILDIMKADNSFVQSTFEADMELRKLSQESAATDTLNTEGDTGQPKRRSWISRHFRRHRKKVKEHLAPDNYTEESPAAEAKMKENREPVVVVSELADSSVVLTIRAWALASDYWTLFYKYNEVFYNLLPQKGVHFPFPQLDVHIDSQG